MQIQSISLTLNGLASGGTKAFMTNPTSCIPATTTARATSYESATPSSRSASFTPSDCAGVPFAPTGIFAPTTVRASQPEGVYSGTSLPTAELPRMQSQIRSSDIYLPQGTAVNPARLAGLTPCTDAQLAVGTADPTTCPASSKVGVVALVSPLVGTSIGDVWFGTGNAAAPLRLFITAKVTATQTAKFVANNTILANGLIKASLQDLPQTPVTTFLLAFPGPTTLLQAPSTCGVHAGAAVFAPWSGTPARRGVLHAARHDHGGRSPPSRDCRREGGLDPACARARASTDRRSSDP